MRSLLRASLVVLTSMGAVSCGAATPVRDLVKSAKWAEACMEVQKTNIVDANPDDLREFDVLAELAPKVPVKMHVRVLPAFEVEKITGLLGGTSLRLPPMAPGLLPILSKLTKGIPGDTFEKDWLVVETTVEVDPSSVAPVSVDSVEIQSRSRLAADPNQPWAPKWSAGPLFQRWTPSPGKPAEQQLAETLGLSRAAGHVGPTVWSLVDLLGLGATVGLIDPGTRGSAPLLESYDTPGRTPSPVEQAALAKLAGFAQTPPCSLVKPGASCTHRALHKRGPEGTANAVEVHILYSLGDGPTACTMGSYETAPLPRASSIAEQVAAAFGEKAAPVAEMKRREEVFQKTGDGCEPGSPRCPPITECAASAACSLEGRCHGENGACAATSGDCEATDSCALLGLCEASGGRCVAPADAAKGCERECALSGQCGKAGELCISERSDQCARSLGCRRFGLCQKEKAVCAAGSSADCAASVACRERGFCSVEKGRCLALTSADCAKADVCARFGACEAREGMCVTK